MPLAAAQGDTRLFITPGYQYRVVDALVTNFHLPQSTLLMLVSALAGVEPIRRAYAHAVAQRYRFFSYGDAMFIESPHNNHDRTELRTARHRRRRPPRPHHAEPRRGRDAHLHARGHLRQRQGHAAARAEGNRLADRAGQHLPPVAAPGHGNHGKAWRPARLHAVGQAHPHRLGRLPGVQPAGHAQDHRGRRQVRLADRWRTPVPDARGIDAHPALAEFGHRNGVRRMHALRDRRPSGHGRGSGPLDAHVAALGAALARRVRPPGQSQRAVRHRPGRHVRIAARRIAGRAAGHRLPRLRHRRPVGGRAQGRHDAHPGARHAQAAGAGAALPDGRGHAGRPGRGRVAGRGHVRLRHADPQRAQRLAVHPFRRRQDPQRQVPRRHPPAGPQLRLPHLLEFRALTCIICSAPTRSPARA